MSSLRERRPIAKRCIAAGLYQKLVNKLGAGFVIKQNMLAPLTRQFPHGEFLHIMYQARNVFVFVARTDNDRQRQALTQQDIDDLLGFQQALLPPDLLQHAYRLAPFLIIAANDKNQYAHLNKKGFCFMNKMVIANIVSLVKNAALAKSSPAIQRRLQSVFSPEITIPMPLSGSDMPFLDHTQEKILKQSLCPTFYANSYISNTHLYQGSAGSGKTLVLLQRAKLLRQLNPTWKILIIAPNTTTLHALKKMQCLIDPDANAEMIGFQQWCRTHVKGVLQFAYPDETLELATDVVERHFDDQCLTPMQLLQELAYSANRAIDTLERYLTTERCSKALALNTVLRARVWIAMQDMAHTLRSKNLHIACDLAPLLWYQVLAGKIDLPKYDAVFIDDAEELAPIGFKLLKQACEVKTGHLFMMANRGQIQQELSPLSALNDTWREAKIAVMEHETVLDQCYRTSEDILQLANRLYITNNQPIVFNKKRPVKRWRWPYKAPVLFHLMKEAEEFDLLVKEISVLLDRGMNARDILIIQAGQDSVRQMAMQLRQRLGLTVSLFGDPQQSQETIYITTLDIISAVESPVVFIVGVHHLFSPVSGEISEGGLRKLYTATMRAQHQLTFMFVGESIPKILQLKEFGVVKNPTKKNNVYPLFPV